MLLVFLGRVQPFFPQSQITFRQLSVKEGLSQNCAISIAQDSTGYLWIASQDGLNKYDGRKFTVFPYTFVDITKPDYSHLGKVYNDKIGNLWIIPSDKIPRKLNSQTQTFDPVSVIDDASAIYQDNAMNLWFGTYSNGLYVLKPKSTEPHHVLPSSKVGGTIYSIAEKKDGTVVLATDRQLLEYLPEIQKVQRVRPLTQYGDSIKTNFSDIEFDNKGRQWIGTFGDGLYFKEMNGDSFDRISELPFTDPLPLNLNILDLHIDSKDRLWIATYGRGLYMLNFNTNKIVHFTAEKYNPKALHYNDILCICEDYSGTLWFGTDGAGASFYDEYLEKFNSLTNYETPENINIDVVRAIAVDKKNTVWIGTSGKGLTRYEPTLNSWITYTAERGTPNTISSDRIMSLWSDTDNDLWIGTQGGGLNIKDKNGRLEHFSPTTQISLAANTIWSIHQGAAGRIWLGTREQGLIQFDKKKGQIEQYKHDAHQNNSLPSNNVRVITEDEKGNLWIGTEANGIVYFNYGDGTFITYRHRTDGNSLSDDKIKSLYLAPNGILWIGTNGGGLNAFDIQNNNFSTYTVAQGLANNVIYSILPDEKRNLWLSSNKGITKFVPGETFESTPEIINYTNYAGLATEFNTGASYKDERGNLYFGGLDGFYWFKPSEIKKNTLLPRTTITGFTVFDRAQPLTEGLELDHNQNTVSFTFSSLQYSLPEKNLYRYKLINYDDDWVRAGNNNFARYTQLPSGNYEFQVKSSNYDGVWNETPVTYAFSIAQPWYANPYAKILYVLLILASIWAVYAYLKWRWSMQLDLQLKEEETRRLQQLNDLKSKLYTDISHEFRTPLTLISGPVDAKLTEGGLSDSDFFNFSMIKRNTNRLICLVDQLLHLAKLEKGKLRLKFSEGNLGLFLGMIVSSFEYQASQKNMEFDIHIENLKSANYDEDALEKIVTNLLSNALKYGREGGRCRFKAYTNEGKLKIEIKNTVAEPSKIEVDKLFARFYQKDEYADGAGVGLSIVKELVQLYEGEISVRMEEEDTILFQVELPIEVKDVKNSVSTETSPARTAIVPDDISDSELLSEKLLENEDSGGLPIILLVEDHKGVRDFLNSAWKDRFRMIGAHNGAAGIEKALETVPDLIISDVQMPVCNGIELCDTLKTDARTSHIPIILLTAGIDEAEELKGLRSGADDFVKKPFKLSILQTRAENLIKTRKALRDRYSQELVQEAKDIAITPTDEIFLNRLQEVLDAHLSDSEFNAGSFSREVGMSRMQLHRKLQAYTGLSTTEFIRSQRLKMALHILKSSRATVNEVAYTVGFNTPSYFIKCFRETYGKTPAAFLQTIRKM